MSKNAHLEGGDKRQPLKRPTFPIFFENQDITRRRVPDHRETTSPGSRLRILITRSCRFSISKGSHAGRFRSDISPMLIQGPSSGSCGLVRSQTSTV